MKIKSILTIVFIIILIICICNICEARRKRLNNNFGIGSNPISIFVNCYYKKNGKFVNNHYRSKRNKTEFDNWSTRGNYNLYTGKQGVRSPRW